jgi:hypothetical protein
MHVLAADVGVEPPDGFGKAPATLNYERSGALAEPKPSAASQLRT